MAIKKGIVVLDGTTETHKFTDDGGGRLGNPELQENGYGTSPITLSGSVFVEGLDNDLVTEFSTQVSVQESASASLTTQMATTATAHDTAWTNANNSMSTELTSLTQKVDAEIAEHQQHQADFTTARGTLSSTASTRIADLSAATSTQVSARISAYDSLTTRLNTATGSLEDMQESASGLFGKDATYTATVTGMVQYAVDMDGASDAAVLDAINAKHQAVLGETEAREAANKADAGEISAEDGDQVDANTLLANQLTAIRLSASSETTAAQDTIDSEIVTRNAAIEAADTSLSARLAAVDGTGAVSTRISADTSIQDDIDAASKAQTGQFNSLTIRLNLQRSARELNISLRGDQKAADINQNDVDQTTAENLIIAEEGAQSTQDTTATTSLATRLTTEKSDFDSNESATRSADISLEMSTRASVDTSMSTVLSTHVSTFNSEKTSLSTRLSNQTDDRVAKRNSLVSRLETDQNTINDMIGGVAFDGTLSHLVSFIDSVDTASDGAVIAAVGSLSTSLSTQVSLREDDDTTVQGLINNEASTRSTQVSLKDDAFAQQATAHSGARKNAMLAATDTMFSELQSETIDPMNTTAGTTITTEVGDAATADTRIGDDTAKSGEVTAESGTDRPSAIVSLQTARAGDASSGDTSLQTRITNLATTLPTGELTLAGTLDGASNVTVDGTMQIGRLTVANVPASYLASDDAHKGKMFYLDCPAGSSYLAAVQAVYDPANGQEMEMKSFMSIFAEPQKWYFYEAGTWHPMPFYHDADGDGVRDQQDDLPTDPTESVDMDGDGVGANTDYDDNDPNVQNAPAALATLHYDSAAYAGYPEEFYLEIDGTVIHSKGGFDGGTEFAATGNTPVPGTFAITHTAPFTIRISDDWGDGVQQVRFLDAPLPDGNVANPATLDDVTPGQNKVSDGTFAEATLQYTDNGDGTGSLAITTPAGSATMDWDGASWTIV